MAIVNYMGEAPGFMSYQRQRSRQPLMMTEKYRRPKSAPPQKATDTDYDYNPGDAQFLSEIDQAFNSGMQKLYNKYGGEMDWVMADPEYKQIASLDKYRARNERAASKNQDLTDDRQVDLQNMNSGQAGSDIEMTYENGQWVAKQFKGRDDQGKLVPVTKAEYLDMVVEQPQVTYERDGTPVLQVHEFDKGTGDEKNFNALVGAFLTDTGDHSWARSNANKTAINNEVMDYARSSFTKRAASGSTNWEQLNDATNYLIEYGFDGNSEYFIAQEMMRDYQNGRSFKIPKMDEEGNIERDKKTGRPKLENYQLSEEDVTDPERMKFLTQFYVQDRIEKYAKKYLDTETSTETVDELGMKNIDPRTGKVIEDPSRHFWQNVSRGEGPVGEGYSTKTTEYQVDENGVVQAVENPNAVIYDDKNAGVYIDRVRADMVGKTLDDVMRSGEKVNLGGFYSEIPEKYWDDLIIADVENVQLRKTEDGKKDQWIGGVKFVVDEDSPIITEGLTFYNATEGKIDKTSREEGFFDWGSDLPGVTSYSDAALNQGIIQEITPEQMDNLGYIKSNLPGTGWDLATEGNDIVITAGIPVGTLMPMWDQQNVGESQRTKADVEFVDAGAEAHNRGKGQSQQMQEAGRQNAVYK